MGKEFLVQIEAVLYTSTMVNVVGISTFTEETLDTTFDFGTLHQPMLTNMLATMTTIQFNIPQALPTLLELSVSKRLPELEILHFLRTFYQSLCSWKRELFNFEMLYSQSVVSFAFL